MKTCSLEMAKRLKDARLQWEPKDGDAYYVINGVIRGDYYYGPDGKEGDLLYIADCMNALGIEHEDQKQVAFAPALSDMLEALDGLGYRAISYHDGCILESRDPAGYWGDCYENDEPGREDAAALALEWALKQAKEVRPVD